MAAHDPHRHPEPQTGSTTVVIEGHGLCAGPVNAVQVMASPHRHSQIEINYLTAGSVEYWFNGSRIALRAGDLAVFWGMAPHRTTSCESGTTFVCLYLPVAAVAAAPLSRAFRADLLGGQMVIAARTLPSDAPNFGRWRGDLLSDDPALIDIVRDEVVARLRRIDHDGWRLSPSQVAASQTAPRRSRLKDCGHHDKVEAMTLFIIENADGTIDAEKIARAVNLHPKYAMTLFKRTVGLTMTEYITRHRLDTAQTLLVAGERDVTEVAFMAGFGSLSRFYEAFVRRFGVSPARYRRGYRESVARGQTALRG